MVNLHYRTTVSKKSGLTCRCQTSNRQTFRSSLSRKTASSPVTVTNSPVETSCAVMTYAQTGKAQITRGGREKTQRKRNDGRTMFLERMDIFTSDKLQEGEGKGKESTEEADSVVKKVQMTRRSTVAKIWARLFFEQGHPNTM